MKSRTEAQLKAERRAVCTRAASGCYFTRLGVGLIDTRVGIDAALQKALALNVGGRVERRLREAHGTLTDPVARDIYLLVRNRLASYGMLPPLHAPSPFERFCDAFCSALRGLRARLVRSWPSNRASSAVKECEPQPENTQWAKQPRRRSR